MGEKPGGELRRVYGQKPGTRPPIASLTSQTDLLSGWLLSKSLSRLFSLSLSPSISLPFSPLDMHHDNRTAGR
jgi:hypothetical protein